MHSAYISDVSERQDRVMTVATVRQLVSSQLRLVALLRFISMINDLFLQSDPRSDVQMALLCSWQ